jgi:hypothetical protein
MIIELENIKPNINYTTNSTLHFFLTTPDYQTQTTIFQHDTFIFHKS